MISLWKTICLSGYFLIISFSLNAQCNNVLQSIAYDTLVVGSGNDSHTFTFPKFDPSIGTLTTVNVNSIVSVNYGFTLTNLNSSSVSFSVGVGRRDNIQSGALIYAYNNTINANIGTYTLASNQTITEASTTIIDRYDNAMNITSNVVDFMGTGNIGFDYSPRTYANHSGGSGYQYSGVASDTIHFSITYFYCNSIVLADDIINFSASKENNEKAKLLWTTVDEQPGRVYEVEKSADGKNFYTAGYVSSINGNNDAHYVYHYQIMANEKTNLWFRLKIKDLSGAVKYSTIRMVDMSNDLQGGIYLYPNPSNQFINLVFNQPEQKNWQVDILAANGGLVQKNTFKNTGSVHIDFQHRLSPGIYFARVIDQQTFKNQVLSFVVR